jgi:hypothetical protein
VTNFSALSVFCLKCLAAHVLGKTIANEKCSIIPRYVGPFLPWRYASSNCGSGSCIIQYRINDIRRKGAVIGIGGWAVTSELLKIYKKSHIAKYYGFYIAICLFPPRVMADPVLSFPDHTPRRNTIGRTSLDEWSARRKDLYLTTHDNSNKKIPCQWRD